eukprot:gene22237-29304_t
MLVCCDHDASGLGQPHGVDVKLKSHVLCIAGQIPDNAVVPDSRQRSRVQMLVCGHASGLGQPHGVDVQLKSHVLCIAGQIPDNAVVYRWSSVVMQVAWGSFMVWMVVLLAGDSVLVGQLWTIKGIFTEVLAFRVITPQVPDHMLTTCPANCFDLNSLVFLE